MKVYLLYGYDWGDSYILNVLDDEIKANKLKEKYESEVKEIEVIKGKLDIIYGDSFNISRNLNFLKTYGEYDERCQEFHNQIEEKEIKKRLTEKEYNMHKEGLMDYHSFSISEREVE